MILGLDTVIPQLTEFSEGVSLVLSLLSLSLLVREESNDSGNEGAGRYAGVDDEGLHPE